jgi:hypothetical protein
MLFNRISAYLEDVAPPPVSEPGPTPLNTVTTPPASFAPIPAGLTGPTPQSASWQEQLYRMAYEAAKAAVEAAARAANQARWN